MPALSPAQILSTTVDQVITGVANGVYARDAPNATARGLEVICAWPVSGQYGPGSRILLSRTYFYDPGRNAIFLWAGLILAGLLSLTVEFYRVQPVLCTMDGQGAPLSSDPKNFPYDAQPACNMICTADTGPQSPMRGGAANNKYVIPAPDKLTLGTGTLLCAACCVHSVLWLASMMDKILEINWKSRFGINDDKCHEPIEGANGTTDERMYVVNETVRFFISVAIVPIFASAGLAVLIVGEVNFFSDQMRFQTEPMASIGQWGPIVGTGIATAGSLYLLLAADIEAAMRGGTSATDSGQACPCEHHHGLESPGRRQSSRAPSSRASRSKDREMADTTSHQGDHEDETLHSLPNRPSSLAREFDSQEEEARPNSSRDVGNRLKRYTSKQSTTSIPKHEVSHSEGGSRLKVAATLVAIGGALGSATHDSFDLSKFRDGAALDFPEIPGEKERNVNLAHVKEIYSKRLGEDGTPVVLASRSRASSFNDHRPSGHALDNLRPSRGPSPRPWQAGSRSASPVPSSSRPRASTLPAQSGSEEVVTGNSPPAGVEPNRGRQRQRRDTLEVPVAAHLRIEGHLQDICSSTAATSHLTVKYSNAIHRLVQLIPDSESQRRAGPAGTWRECDVIQGHPTTAPQTFADNVLNLGETPLVETHRPKTRNVQRHETSKDTKPTIPSRQRNMASSDGKHEALQPIHPSMAGKLDPVFEKLYNDNVANTPSEPIDLALLRSKYSVLYSYGTGPAPDVGRVYDEQIPLDDGTDTKLNVRVYEPDSEGPWPVHIDYHGGGWGLGDLDTESHICRHICQKADVVVIDVDYRLVPEHAFPVGITDGFAALKHVHARGAQRFNIKPDSISLGGVSAGACIALALAHLARDNEPAPIPLRLVAAGVPVVDDLSRYSSASESPFPSMRDNEWAPTLNWRRLAWFDKLKWSSLPADPAAREAAREKVAWFANLLQAPDFRNLPKTLIYTAGADPLRDEGERYANVLVENGVEVTLRRFPGVPHPFMHMDKHLWQAREFIDRMAREIRIALHE
ncbi:hypothetical protein EsDP_00006377 [Epichloe bromicola]|uniref:Alpha/beta hydrolase fold-3 domain-containing protein n=1 Tax=Epichloe bromicola TaxID=79588 RepID=A0ABQ0CXG8_9HYPO